MKKKALSIMLALTMCLGLTVPALAAPEQRTVRARNEDELLAALSSNTTIILEDKTYVARLWMENLENVTIQGTGSTRLVIDDGADDVVTLSECKNITLSGLVMGHDIEPEGGCSSGVVSGWGGSTLTIVNCDIFGCGLTGISFFDGSITMQDSVIRDCSEEIMSLSDGQFTFQNCTFSGNGYSLGSSNDYSGIYAGAYEGETVLTFSGCTFTNNKMGKFLEVFEREGGKVTCTQNACSFSGNSWPESTIPSGSESMPVTAQPTNDMLTCDGVLQTSTVYKIGDSNYFKIRDLAAILNGTEKQFSVGYDGEKQSVTADTGAGYEKQPADLTGAPAGGSKTAVPSSDAIYINGVLCQAEVYKIDGMNYFKLRDLGQALDFGVGWDGATGTVTLDTTRGYETQTPAAPSISDQELMELADELVQRSINLGVWIANAGFAETDDNDTITVNQEDWDETYSRVISYQTIAQAEQAARDLWHQTFSRRAPGVSEHELDMMRGQFLERDGVLYKSWGRGVGGGGGVPVLDRMISRTAEEAVFAAHMDWGSEDDELNASFEFSLVLEDGEWRYLEH